MRANSGINYVFQIPDIETGGYCFTDGIGLISWGLAGRVAQKMNIPLARKVEKNDLHWGLSKAQNSTSFRKIFHRLFKYA